MAWFVDGWIWEPVDLVVLRCARDGRPFRNSPMYRMAAEALEREGFIAVKDSLGDRMTASLTSKGQETAKKVL